MKKIILCVGLLAALFYKEDMLAAAASAAASSASAVAIDAVTKKDADSKQQMVLKVWIYQNDSFDKARPYYAQDLSSEQTLKDFVVQHFCRNAHVAMKVHPTNSGLSNEGIEDLMIKKGATKLSDLIPTLEKGEDGIPYFVYMGITKQS